MKFRTMLWLSAALALPLSVSVMAAEPGANTASKEAPVAQPETDPALANSGKLVPGQSIRPESDEEASVPKTPMDKAAANSADVGAEKTNMKANRSMAGADTGNVPKEPKHKP